MRLIFVLGISIMLSACAVQKVQIENIKPDASIEASLPIDAAIAIFVPYKESEEKIVSHWGYGNKTLLEPGADLKKASVDVAAKYFREAEQFSLDKPTHYLLRLEGQATLDVVWGAYKTVVHASLYKSNGELVEKKEVTGSVISGVVNDENAFYNAYVSAMKSYFNGLFKDNSGSLEKYASNESYKPLTYDNLKSEGSIDLVGTGSGFVINESGDVVTNYHVIKQCLAVTVNHDGAQTKAKIVASDKEGDIAVLHTGVETQNFAVFVDAEYEGRLGEEIITVGYPLHGVLSSKPSLTTGNISALAGLEGDEKYLQISAPIQPGNSGGPLISNNGLVYGVVQSKLNAIRLAQFTGDIAQNINFAVKKKSVIKVLKENGIMYSTQKTAEKNKMETPDIADEATRYTLQVMCHG
nr:serine protease [uncultured Methylophaga sp.]